MSNHEPCCAACGGAGADLSGPCPDCHGTGCAHPIEDVAAQIAEILWSARTPDGLRAATRPDCYAMAQALIDADRVVTPEHDAAVVEKFLHERDTPSVTPEESDEFEGITGDEAMRLGWTC